eukprot:869647-Rhodomonas_salina.3
MKSLTTKFAHVEGYASMVFAPVSRGHKIITCGNDNLVKLHDLDKAIDDDPGIDEFDHFKKPVYAVAGSPDGQWIAAGGEETTVALFNLDTLDFDKVVARSELPINDLCFTPNSEYLIVASDDATIRVVK